MMDKITDYTVTEQEIQANGVQAVPGEVLYGEPSENKKVFDRLATLIIRKYNTALEWLVDKAHVHANKELIDTIQIENVHAHANKDILDTVQEENVHAHANKTVLDTIVKDTQVHEHTNKQLLDTIEKPEQIHEHINKDFLDTLDPSDIHTHDNKTALDTITSNLIAAWNNSAGVAEGKTDLDFGSFTGKFDKLQIRRGEAADLPVLHDGEFGFCSGKNELYIGSTTGNAQIAMYSDVMKTFADYIKTADVDKKLELYYPKTDTYSKTEMNEMLAGAGGGIIVSADAPPGDSSMLWIDTTSGGIAKYWNGNAWVASKAVWG